ncbi:NAD(P)H-dependent oxidoreductase [Porticoccaceae bacterium LTM1]|nr:NAD(P)H-dependent oxidoreductase [Porticoccaceae bacterium LTM1]
MNRILSLQTSLFDSNSASRSLSIEFIEQLRQKYPHTTVTERDLAKQPIAHLTADSFSGFGLPEDQRSESQQQAAKLSDELIAELQASDVIVLGLPLYNFGIPSTLKSWIDHIARAGVTFRYTENGPQGLLNGKKLYVIATRGGQYAGTPADTQTDYIRNFYSFLGITDIEFVYAEGLAMGEIRDQSLSQASEMLHHKAAA